MGGWLATLSGGYLGWAIGSNDCANFFGPQIGANVLSYRVSTILFAVFVVLGSFFSGASMVHDAGAVFPAQQALQQYTSADFVWYASFVTISAALVVTLATVMGLPVSTSQGAIGAFFGLSFALGLQHGSVWTLPPWFIFGKMAGSWVISPVLSGVIAAILSAAVRRGVRAIEDETLFNRLAIGALSIAGVYGSYVMGSSHAGIIVAPFYRAGIFQSWIGIDAARWAATFGGVTIAAGGLTYGRRVMEAVGSHITELEPVAAFSAVMAMSLVLHGFKQYGVPISASQSVVGAVAGVGLSQSTQAVNFATLRSITLSWVATPLVPAAFTAGCYGLYLTALPYTGILPF